MYDVRVNDVTAFVLAGGKSTRMGQDKAFIELAGETLLERAVETARVVASEVWIVGEVKKFEGFATGNLSQTAQSDWAPARMVEDIFPGCGPLGGIHAALASSATELNLVLAVDLPLVTADLLSFLIEEARASGAIVTVPRSEGRLHPLCAVYRSAFKDVAERALTQGKNKIDRLFGACETRVIDEGELASGGFLSKHFRNVNTPQELEAAQRMLGGST